MSESDGRCVSEAGTLVATVLGSSLAFVVGSIINVALPSMQADFGTDAAGVQWIVNAYLLPLSALVLVGGSLGDHYGRKRLFMLGLAIFTVATVACALAPNLETLLGLRFAQGIGAALLAPNSLAIIADGFSGEKRGKAVGTWAAAGAIAGAAAPVIGGFVIDNLDWRWAFAIVIPPAAAAWMVGQRSICESRESEEDRVPLDLTGAILATSALGALVFALISLPERGWADLGVVSSTIAGLALGTAFLAVEIRKGRGAMMPLGIFGSASFSGISILTLMLYAALGGLMVLLPYMLIESLGYSATAAGAALLPFPLIMGILSRTMGGLATRIGIRTTLTIGPLLVAFGFALFAFSANADLDYWTDILPGLIAIAIGMALCVAPLTTAVMNAVENRYVGVASGVNNAISRIAGLIATALLGFVLIGENGADADLISGFESASWVGAVLAAASAAASFVMIRVESTES
ncbi:DHA2 family efflux MFS transporter permease subunit [Erythrobacter ani]|uniref:DHA2 family efflux MFS transporter permease subunit n=1 Tax=Erythrobacter ani TaxID=2827235 RepID=A0ABS6SJI2_9SPHN|nr:DHA2 family efflux MFS transporter permease subunit [Erythrobacter ani]